MLTSVSDQFGLEQATILRVISQHMAAIDECGVFTITQVMVSKGFAFDRVGDRKTFALQRRNIMAFEDDPLGSGEAYIRYLYREHAKLNGGVLGGGVLPDSAEKVTNLVKKLERYAPQIPWLQDRLSIYQAQGPNKTFEKANILMGIMLRIRKEKPEVTTYGEIRDVTFSQFAEKPCSVFIGVPGEAGKNAAMAFIAVAKEKGASGGLKEVKDDMGQPLGWDMYIEETIPLLRALGYEPVEIDFDQINIQQAGAVARVDVGVDLSDKRDLRLALSDLASSSPRGKCSEIGSHMRWTFDIALAERIMKFRLYERHLKQGIEDLPDLLSALAGELHVDPGDLVKPLAVAMYLQRTQFDGNLTAAMLHNPGVKIRMKDSPC